jgi:capsule biosynthesis phosphatase
MYICIPLGGLGTRFSKYSRPKPLIPVFGKPILYWLLDVFRERHADFTFVVTYHPDMLPFHFESQLRNDYPSYSFFFVSLKQSTRGASETLFITFSEMEKKEMTDQGVLCIDGDVFFRNSQPSSLDISYKIIRPDTNYVICFEDVNPDPIYSYVEVNPEGRMTRMVEKEKISNYACCGGYGFSSWKTAMHYCIYIIDNQIMQKNEFYTSTVIQTMIQEHHTFEMVLCSPHEYVCLGTPIQLRTFCNNYPIAQIKPRRFCFDLDNTLVSYPVVHGDYTTVLPNQKNIEYLRYLKKCGNVIIIHTARRMRTHGGNTGKVMRDVGKITLDTLEKFQIPYDELYFGKPDADYYIDDKAVSCFVDMEKETGFYSQTIEARDFNSIQSYHSIETLRKSSIQSLAGEIRYYQTLPLSCKDLFPFFFEYDTADFKWYTIEKIKGVSISHLYLSQELSPLLFKHIMSAINRIHTQEIRPEHTIEPQLMYSNYLTKLKKRFGMFDYSIYPHAERIYTCLVEKLGEYEQKSCGKLSMIHGDPVFTNIILNQFGKIKFIDPRGILDDILTPIGDVFYDYAKIYQSLIGYDEILLQKKIPASYKSSLIELFRNEFCSLYSKEDWGRLQYITASLYFTLIPLHQGLNGEKYMMQIETLLS